MNEPNRPEIQEIDVKQIEKPLETLRIRIILGIIIVEVEEEGEAEDDVEAEELSRIRRKDLDLRNIEHRDLMTKVDGVKENRMLQREHIVE